MKFKLNVGGGGIFSKYILILQNIALTDFEKLYLNISDERTNSNMFDFIFNQKLDENFLNFDCGVFPAYTSINKVEDSRNFQKYKNIINKLEFQEKILKKVTKFKNELDITEETIGVHIRLTDMNIHHPFYGVKTFDNYLIHFESDKKYFVASDNQESLDKLKIIFGDNIKFIPNMIRGVWETENTLDLQLDNFKNSQFWEEAFIEMLLLSRCGSLICNTSGLSSASIIHSNTIRNIIRI